MDSKSNCKNCSGYNLVGLAASLAVVISEQFDADDLAILAAFVTALGDNLALLASTKEC